MTKEIPELKVRMPQFPEITLQPFLEEERKLEAICRVSVQHQVAAWSSTYYLMLRHTAFSAYEQSVGSQLDQLN